MNKFYLLFLISLNNLVQSERILAIFPLSAKSHYVAFEKLALELVKRGHELVVINNYPQKPPVKNFLDIDISQYMKSLVNGVTVNELLHVPDTTIDECIVMNKLLQHAFKSSEIPFIKKLFTNSTNEKFDLIIVEMFDTYLYFSLSYKFKSPIIGFTSSTMLPWINTRFANPDNPSYIPCITSQHYTKMNFRQRLVNSLETFIAKMFHDYVLNPQAEVFVKNYFGDENFPSLSDLAMNASLLLFNSHHSFHGARPLVPQMIEVGGLHIGPKKTIPEDLEKFLNESEHGVIYFCMGSMLKASTLPEEKRIDIIEVFSKLKQRVLWKWETEEMPDKPDNVKLVKWMPQRDVLAHPNIKLFITHGGLLGTTEAVYEGVPIIGVPFYGDQGVNIEAVQANGAGIRLDFHDLNKHTLYNAIKEILENSKYAENAKQLSERFRDRPMSPLETAVYWTEYVIRHKGAPHLRSAAVDLTWYQYLLLDVISFLIVSFLLILAILYYTIRLIYRLIKRLLCKEKITKSKTESKNKKE